MIEESSDFTICMLRNLSQFIDLGFVPTGPFRFSVPSQTIIHTQDGVFLVKWGDMKLKRLRRSDIQCPDGLGPLLPSHPPNFDFSHLDIETMKLPVTIAYSVSDGPLCGRAGHVTILKHDEFVDSAHVIS
ncbi:MAG: hypothetical protein ACK58L_14195 [Planctomycetota bacterium]